MLKYETARTMEHGRIKLRTRQPEKGNMERGRSTWCILFSCLMPPTSWPAQGNCSTFFFLLNLWHWVNCIFGSKKLWACRISEGTRTGREALSRAKLVFASTCWQLQPQCKQCHPRFRFCHKDHSFPPPLLLVKVSVFNKSVVTRGCLCFHDKMPRSKVS